MGVDTIIEAVKYQYRPYLCTKRTMLCLTLRLNDSKQKPTGIINFKSLTVPSMPRLLVHASIKVISWLPMI